MRILDALERLSVSLDRLCKLVCGILLVLMLVVVNLGVIARFVLNAPLSWTEEMLMVALIWTTMLGAAIALKEGSHISLQFFRDRLPASWALVADVAARAAVLLFLVLLIDQGSELAAFVSGRQTLPNLRISMGWAYAALPIGSAVMSIHLCAWAGLALRRADGKP